MKENGELNNFQPMFAQRPEKYFIQTRNEMFSFASNQAFVRLDVGCGAGYFGEVLLQSYGGEVWGVEPSKDVAQEALKRLTGVYNGTIESFLSELNKKNFSNKEIILKKKFDEIFFNDIIEHLIDPWKILNSIKSILKPNGFIIASIPNIRYYRQLKSLVFEKEWKYQDKGILDRTHLRFFTKKSIIRTFNECGYEMLKIEGINKTRKLIPKAINIILCNQLDDILFKQFAVIVKAST